MKKVYFVEMLYHNTEIEKDINGAYIDSDVIKTFSTQFQAEKWIEKNFCHYVNTVDGFCDFKIVERSVDDSIEDEEAKDATIDDEMWISASVDTDLKKIRISGFIRYSKDFNEFKYPDHMQGTYDIFCELPKNLHSRSEVVDFIKSKIADFIKSKKKAGEIKK